MNDHDAQEGGFTLLEVLVALVVTGLAIGAAFHVFGTSFQGQARAERITSAALIAESKMAEVGATIALRPGTSSGRTADGYAWQTDIRALDSLPQAVLQKSPVRAFEVEVRVSWPGAAVDTILLRTLRLRARDRDD